jgi:hypothetical protein
MEAKVTHARLDELVESGAIKSYRWIKLNRANEELNEDSEQLPWELEITGERLILEFHNDTILEIETPPSHHNDGLFFEVRSNGR